MRGSKCTKSHDDQVRFIVVVLNVARGPTFAAAYAGGAITATAACNTDGGNCTPATLCTVILNAWSVERMFGRRPSVWQQHS